MPPANPKTRALDTIEAMSSRIDHFTDRAIAFLEPSPSSNPSVMPNTSTPHRLTEAIRAVKQEKGWLPAVLRLKFQGVLEANRTSVIAYNALDMEDVEYRRLWILNQIGLTPPPGYDLLSDTLFPIPEDAGPVSLDFNSFTPNDVYNSDNTFTSGQSLTDTNIVYTPGNISHFLSQPY